MSTTVATTPDLWRSMLRAEAEMQTYFSARVQLGDIALMVCSEADEFNVALVDDVPPFDVEDALAAILDFYARVNAAPRVRLSPFSSAGWKERLRAQGFVQTPESRRFWIVPETLEITGNSALEITAARSICEADAFAEIQAIGYRIPTHLQEWDRSLARLHVARGEEHFYLGCLDGEFVAVIATRMMGNGIAGLWGLAALPEVRGRGVGSAMLGRAAADARARGADHVFFTTAHGNPVESLYHRLGVELAFETATFERRRVSRERAAPR